MLSPTTVREIQLNERIKRSETEEAFEEFYADDVVMQENNEKPTVGKDANRQRERGFAEKITLHGFELVDSAIHDDVSFSQWKMDVTMPDGKRVVREQVAVRRWAAGKVTHERFFYGE